MVGDGKPTTGAATCRYCSWKVGVNDFVGTREKVCSDRRRARGLR